MSGGIPIRFRRTQLDTPVDTPSLGEPLIHLPDSKLGFYDGTTMLWYPGLEIITNRMVMNAGQKLTGKDSAGDANIDISFDTPDALEIIYRPTNTVLAKFSTTGATFNTLAASQQMPGGSLNRGSHPGFLPQFFSTTAMSTATKTGWFGPNTYLWKKGGAVGDLSIKYEYKTGSGAITHEVVDTYTLRVDASGGPTNGVGVRTWLFDPSLGYITPGQNKNKVFISIVGTAGQSCQIRVGRAGSYTSVAVTGTDNWQRVAIDIPAHAQSTSFTNGGTNEPFAVDLIYNPTGGVWFLGEPTVQNVDVYTTEVYQYRSISERLSMMAAYYWEPSGINIYGTDTMTVNLPIRLPIYNLGVSDFDVDIISTAYPVTITAKGTEGFTASTTTVNTSWWTFKPRIGYRGSTADII